ncbi:hypothetical protein, partial [Vallitalea sp.]|uniref:hypothetical protein n=1 Tax=Vallitalea sp. TaxID=1882829 RepID=UPI0025F6CC23
SKETNTKWLAVETNTSNTKNSFIDTNQSAKTIIPQGIKVSIGKADITINTGFDKEFAIKRDYINNSPQ